MPENEPDGPRGSRFLRVGQVARDLGYTNKHVLDLIRSGALPSVRLGEKTILIPKAAIDALHDEAMAGWQR